MQDAESSHPVCGDIYAKNFMNEDGLQIFEAFKDDVSPNASNVARHRIIDDLLRQKLSANPELRIFIIGAGFDSRAFRLKGGSWIEFDEPQVIAYKNERLPVANCENELHRIPIDFSNDSLEEKLLPFSNTGQVIFVIEGVLMYLDKNVIRQTLETLRNVFPQHQLICDLMNRKFFEKYSKNLHNKIAAIGTSFKFTAENPQQLFLENGYELKENISIVEKASEFELLNVPKVLLKTLFRTLANGYAIYVFNSK